MKAPHKRGVDAVKSGVLNMSEQEDNVGADCLTHAFWGVLYDSFRHFSNPLSPEAAQARYMDPKFSDFREPDCVTWPKNWHLASY